MLNHSEQRRPKVPQRRRRAHPLLLILRGAYAETPPCNRPVKGAERLMLIFGDLAMPFIFVFRICSASNVGEGDQTMRTNNALIIAAALLLGLLGVGGKTARADNSRPMTGADLAVFCEGGSLPASDATGNMFVSMCAGYVIGVGEAIQHFGVAGICPPAKITAFPLLTDLESLSKASPDTPAAVLIARAMLDIYPCTHQ